MAGADESRESRDFIGALTDTRKKTKPNFVPQLKRWALEHRWSLLFLWLPTALTAIYYFLIAAPMYVSEAEFVVRSPSHPQIGSLAGLLQGTGIAKAPDDVYSVNDFIQSRDAITALEKDIDLRGLFGRPEADYLARYPNLFYDRTGEEFYKYYQKRVSADYDTTTQMITVTVKAFTAQDAQKLASLLIQESEALVNRLNERAHDNAIRDAEKDVKLAEDHVVEAQQNMLGYRTREKLLDPGKSSGVIFETVAKLQGELVATQMQLAEIEHGSPDSPIKSELQTRISTLQQQVQNQKSKLTGSDGSMAPKIPEYEQLMLQQEFASKELASTMASLESARAEARRQQIYLDRVVEADLPDKSMYPKRLISVLIVFVSCFLAYSIGSLLLAGVREHTQE
jgi:capsular polysaccharide transport system permease protein